MSYELLQEFIGPVHMDEVVAALEPKEGLFRGFDGRQVGFGKLDRCLLIVG